MRVSVYQNQTQVGTAILEHLDPPMGVAFGPFTPTQHYDRHKHANVVEGNYVGDRSGVPERIKAEGLLCQI